MPRATAISRAAPCSFGCCAPHRRFNDVEVFGGHRHDCFERCALGGRLARGRLRGGGGGQRHAEGVQAKKPAPWNWGSSSDLRRLSPPVGIPKWSLLCGQIAIAEGVDDDGTVALSATRSGGAGGVVEEGFVPAGGGVVDVVCVGRASNRRRGWSSISWTPS